MLVLRSLLLLSNVDDSREVFGERALLVFFVAVGFFAGGSAMVPFAVVVIVLVVFDLVASAACLFFSLMYLTTGLSSSESESVSLIVSMASVVLLISVMDFSIFFDLLLQCLK